MNETRTHERLSDTDRAHAVNARTIALLKQQIGDLLFLNAELRAQLEIPPAAEPPRDAD